MIEAFIDAEPFYTALGDAVVGRRNVLRSGLRMAAVRVRNERGR